MITGYILLNSDGACYHNFTREKAKYCRDDSAKHWGRTWAEMRKLGYRCIKVEMKPIEKTNSNTIVAPPQSYFTSGINGYNP